MPEYEQIVKVKEDAERKLRAIPGVHAVGIGRKSVGGKLTDELSIAVFVTSKKPLDQLTPDEVIPPEIDGVKTDVVEMSEPRLIMAANPANLVATRNPNQLSVTFSSSENEPGGGLLVMVEFGVAATGGTLVPHVASYQTSSWDTLNDIAKAVAKEISGRNMSAIGSATPNGAQVTLTPAAGFINAITNCDIKAIDDNRYFEDHVRAGIQIQAGGSGSGVGSIGLLATTAVTAQDPQGKVVAITCQHVVCLPGDQTTNLVVAVTGNQIGFGVNSLDPIPLGSQVVLTFRTADKSFFADVFYTTVAGDQVTGVINSVIAAVTAANLTGIKASLGTGGLINVVMPAGVSLRCVIYGPPKLDSDSDLTATVVGATITFTGEVGGDDYGIFTSVDTGGIAATCGAFTNPTEDDTLSGIATKVAAAFNAIPASKRGTMGAKQTANSVTFQDTATNTPAERVTCDIQSDMQVGQPDNSFGSPCSHCCSHRIGRVIDSRTDIDIALIQLDAGQKWVPEIEGIGLVSGIHSLSSSDLNLPVMKRGRTLSAITWGTISHLKISGDIGGNQSFQRHYVDAIRIMSTAPNSGPFGLPGDSGSAVVDVLGGVIGIIFGAGDLEGLVTPIDAIVSDAFPDYQLNPAPAPEAGHAPGDIRTVPKSAMAAATAEDEAVIAMPRPFLQKRLLQVEKEISATLEGSEYAELVKRHFAETQRLVNSNRRVATVWHRNGGPQILQAFLTMLQRRDERLPNEINGRPFVDCLERIRQAFARYASPALAADLTRFALRLQSFAGLSYTQMLSALRSESGD